MVLSLAKTISDKATQPDLLQQQLRECRGTVPDQDASLNLWAYIALYSYGYRNVYELGPLVDLKDSKVELDHAGTNE